MHFFHGLPLCQNIVYCPFTKLPHCQSVCKLPHCRSETSNFYVNVGAKIRNFKFEVKFNKFCFFHSKYYLHQVAAQEEDMECKRILLTAREKHNIVNYCLERGELTPLI
jgi:Rad3-related DNA helicase